MPLFNAKLDYALRAVVDLALQPSGVVCQSRDIAGRQGIRGPYLDQILAILNREGIVRSVRGAGGGYMLAQPAQRIRVGDVVRAMIGDRLLLGGDRPDSATSGASHVVRLYEEETEKAVCGLLDSVTVADLAARKERLDDSMSYMSGI